MTDSGRRTAKDRAPKNDDEIARGTMVKGLEGAISSAPIPRGVVSSSQSAAGAESQLGALTTNWGLGCDED